MRDSSDFGANSLDFELGGWEEVGTVWGRP